MANPGSGSKYCAYCGRKKRGIINGCKGHSWKEPKFRVSAKEESENHRNRARKVHNIECKSCKGKGCKVCYYVGKRLVRDGE